ncbi:transposable element Tcb2 transposase [Trichonephila clavipes]|nr:transposable element Tcb2 transposase [Trichonephila clavipes]
MLSQVALTRAGVLTRLGRLFLYGLEEELQEILNEEHQETQRNVSPSEQEEDERGPMPTSAIKDLLKKWEAVRAMVLEWHPNQADVSRTTSRHRRDRREWATENVNWRRNEWSNVLFSDESRFPVHPDNRRIFIWKDRGSRNNPAFVHESVRFGGGGVLVYGGISIDGRTDLYIIRDGPLTARRYRDEILRPIVVPYAATIGDDFILMDDNCRPHRPNLVEDFLFEEGIIRKEWPASSPDMNPIEHVWDALGRRVAGRQLPPQTLQELERALLEEWDRIPQLVINSVIDSLPQRCSTLLAVRGNHIP